MGLSLRLGIAGGSVFVPSGAYEALASQLGDFREPAEADLDRVKADCRFEEFRRYPSLQLPYDFIHLLRRLWIRSRLDPAWVPTPIGRAEDDAEYENYVGGSSRELVGESHLCHHGDADGAYIPVDFHPVAWAGRYSIGSTVRLMSELRELGVLLELPNDEAVAAYLLTELDETDPWEREKFTFCALYEMARLSLAYRTSLVFS